DYIELSGIHFHGGSAVLAESHHCVIDNCHFRYDSHFSNFTYRYDALASGSNSNKLAGNRGIYISGSNNEIKNSSIVYSAASGVILADTANRVTNCLIHDIDYIGTYAAGVFFGQPSSRQYSSGHTVSYCTIYNCGRSCINFHRVNKYDADIRLLNNNLYASMCISQDGGTIYADSLPSNNIEIGYNWFHEVYTGPGCYVYFDHLGGRGCNIHHNVFFKNPRAQRKFLTFSARNAYMYNNTFVARHKELSSLTTLLRIYKQEHPDMTANNLDATIDRAQWMFVDTLNMDYRLRAGSPAIDSGIDIPGITDAAVGQPDLGAYEYGGEHWVPGHDWGEPPDVTWLWGSGKPVKTPTAPQKNAVPVPTVYVTDGKLLFRPDDHHVWDVSLYDFTGATVARWKRRRLSVLPLHALPSGLYSVRMHNGKTSIVRRIVLAD
ncbi:MAG: hypothetical protein GF350_10935, partial [Chitinivibrionales bacterium]|nr:hypothetical protein [Chitinivibrionales bacterium]